jgi:AraC family transcriptional regulator
MQETFQEKPQKLDSSKESDILQVVPNPPVFASMGMNWHGIQAGCCHQPAHETPEFCLGDHAIHIHAGRPNTVKLLAEDGHLRDGLHQNGDAGIIPAHQSQKMSWQGDMEFIHLYLEPSFMQQVAAESMNGKSIELTPQLSARDLLIQGVGLALMSELKFNKAGSRLYAETAGTMLAVHLIQRYTVWKQTIQNYADGLPKYKLYLVLDYIKSHLDQDLSLNELACLVKISPYYFARLFKQSTGSAPHQYITQRRIEKAKKLLSRQDLSIIEITHQVGFQSQSHFTTLFRRAVGVTPKVYKDSL